MPPPSLPRAKGAAQARMAAARDVTDGPIVVDGQKTDGVEPLLRALRARATVSEAFSKAHGKVFVVQGGDFADWAGRTHEVDGMTTRPGVFSAEHVDPGCHPKVTELHLVEADLTALDCARDNVTDPRARFHWDDATTHRPEARYDAVVTNPPFHDGRAGDPAIGRAFIAAAAGMLQRHGVLWLVANRHLPYEQALSAAFADVTEIGGDPRYKLFKAARPRGPGRGQT